MHKQLAIPGFESFVSNQEEVIKYLEGEGFYWLTDFNNGGNGNFYVPYRIQFPDGKILDEGEIFQDFSDLEKKEFSRESIQLARNYYCAINDEDTDKDKYKFNNISFVSEEDEKTTIERYLKKPFWSKCA